MARARDVESRHDGGCIVRLRAVARDSIFAARYVQRNRAADRTQGNLATAARHTHQANGDGRVVAEGIGRVGENRQGGEVLFNEI